MKRPSRADIRQILTYGVVGVLSSLVDGGTFLVLHHFGVMDLVANATGYALAFLVNFNGNRVIVFKAKGVRGALWRYCVLVAFNLLVSTGLVHLGLMAGLSAVLAKLISMIVVALINFAAMRWWVFRQHNQRVEPAADDNSTSDQPESTDVQSVG